MKLKFLLAMLPAALMAMACQPSDADFTPKLDVRGNSLAENAITVKSSGDEITLSVTSNVTYSIASDKDWVETDPVNVENADKKDKKTSVRLYVTPNTSEEARTAVVRFTCDDYPAVNYTLNIRQNAAKKSLEVLTMDQQPVSAPIEVDGFKTEIRLMVTSTVSWTATSDQQWLTSDPAENTNTDSEEQATIVTLGIAANTITEAREATVTFTGEGVEPVSVTVKQAAKKVYTFDINVTGIGAYTATISCTPSDATVNYHLSYAPVATVNEMGGIEAYANAELKYLAEELEDVDMEQVLAIIFAPGDRDQHAAELEETTEYCAFACAVDAEWNIISDITRKDFTTIRFNPSEEYKKWLGTWKMGSGNTFYDVTITPYSEFLYTIDGYEGGGENQYPPFLAVFNEETNGLAFVGNENLATVTVTDRETGAEVPCYLGFFATGDDDLVYAASYKIAEATLSDGSNATVKGCKLLTDEESGTEVTMVSMQYWAVPMEGNSVYRFSEAPLFPLTMTKTGELPAETNAAFAADKVVSIEKTTRQLMKAVSTEKASVRKFAGINTLKLR